MHPNTVLRKTAKGQEEVATRQHGLNIRQRALLIPVDGVKSAEDITRFHPDPQQALAMLKILLEQGFVEVVMSIPTVTSTPVTPVTTPQPSPVASGLDSIRLELLKRYLVEFVDTTLGVMGTETIARIQASKDLAELLSIAQSCAEVVAAVAGSGKAKAFQDEVKKLMS